MYDYYDYGYDYGYYASDEVTGLFTGILLVYLVVGLLISVLMIISLFKIFKKNGKPGWYAIIPFLNIWTFLELGGQKGWAFFVPFYNIYALIAAMYKIPVNMGYSKTFGILNIFFSPVVLPIIAFKKNKNVQPTSNNQVNNIQQNNIEQIVNTNQQPVIEPQQSVNVVPEPQVLPQQPVNDMVEIVEQTNIQNNIEQSSIQEEIPTNTSTSLKCTVCGSENPNGSMFCYNCGHKF